MHKLQALLVHVASMLNGLFCIDDTKDPDATTTTKVNHKTYILVCNTTTITAEFYLRMTAKKRTCTQTSWEHRS